MPAAVLGVGRALVAVVLGVRTVVLVVRAVSLSVTHSLRAVDRFCWQVAQAAAGVAIGSRRYLGRRLCQLLALLGFEPSSRHVQCARVLLNAMGSMCH